MALAGCAGGGCSGWNINYGWPGGWWCLVRLCSSVGGVWGGNGCCWSVGWSDTLLGPEGTAVVGCDLGSLACWGRVLVVWCCGFSRVGGWWCWRGSGAGGWWLRACHGRELLGCWCTGVCGCSGGRGGVWRVRSLLENCTVDASIFVCLCGQVCKGTGWMPWHEEPKKDVVACDKPRGVGKRTVIRGCPNGGTPHESCRVTRT